VTKRSDARKISQIAQIIKEKPMFKTFSMSLLGLLALSAAQAQSSQPILAKVPFAFTVQNTNFAAGSYQLTYSDTAHILEIRGLDQKSVGLFANFMPGGTASSNVPGRLVFQCHAMDCDLAQVWGAASGERGLLRKTPHQIRLAFTASAVSVTIPAK
jgi:hypothetical protein